MIKWRLLALEKGTSLLRSHCCCDGRPWHGVPVSSLPIIIGFTALFKMSQTGAYISAWKERPLTCPKRELIRRVGQNLWIKSKGHIKLGISKLCKHAWSQKYMLCIGKGSGLRSLALKLLDQFQIFHVH